MSNHKTNGLIYYAKKLKFYLRLLLRWTVVSMLVGITGGLVGSLFVLGVDTANEVWFENRWLTLFLPIAGLVIVFIYHFYDLRKEKGTNRIIDKVRADDDLPVVVGPLIFVSTLITHLFGGSAGREGAAVQIGGSIGSGFAKHLKVDDKDASLIVLSGVAAVFAALFGTPVAAVFFALEVVSVGIIYYSGLIPCLIASITAFCVTRTVGIEKTDWSFVKIPEMNIKILLMVAIISICAALISVCFVVSVSSTKKFLEKKIQNDYWRVVAGGIAIIALSFVFSSGDYNGAGDRIILDALQGEAVSWACFAKILFTAITLGAGFKGGEIVPTFFIGSTMGVVIGTLLGIEPGFAAAIGLIATFCGAVNCPIASIILAMEVFGEGGLMYFAVACAISYTFSGYYSLYSSQKIVYSKTKALYVDAKTRH